MAEAPERKTPVTYAREEVVQIRKLLRTPGAQLVCPRCGGNLMVSRSTAAGSVAAMLELRCLPCRRTILLRDQPERRDER